MSYRDVFLTLARQSCLGARTRIEIKDLSFQIQPDFIFLSFNFHLFSKFNSIQPSHDWFSIDIASSTTTWTTITTITLLSPFCFFFYLSFQLLLHRLLSIFINRKSFLLPSVSVSNVFFSEIWSMFTFIWLLKLFDVIAVTWDSLSRFVSLEIVFWTENSFILDVERWICMLMLTRTFKPTKYELVLHFEQWCLWIVWASFPFYVCINVYTMVALLLFQLTGLLWMVCGIQDECNFFVLLSVLTDSMFPLVKKIALTVCTNFFICHFCYLLDFFPVN